MYELDEIKGVDIGETYRNEKQVVNFAHYIAKTEKQKLVDQINELKYISVICDGCTDTAAIEEEIVYVRTCNKGDIKTSKVNDLFFISICFPNVNTFNFIKFIHSYKVCEWTSLFYQSMDITK
jgi:hypothetical protein